MAVRKPVHAFSGEDVHKIWDYAYNAISAYDHHPFLASDSLRNLKAEVKRRRWRSATLQCRDGCFSYGQNLVDGYPYVPRYW